MDLSINSGVQLTTVYVRCVKPFTATLLAKVPRRDGVAGTTTTAGTTETSDNDAAHAAPTPPAIDNFYPDDVWTDGGAAAAVAAADSANTADRGSDSSLEVEGDYYQQQQQETPVSPSVPGTTMGSGFGRPRVGMSKIAETTSSFEALGLALRYPASKIFVRSELLAPGEDEGTRSEGGGGDSSLWSFDSADLAEMYPNLMKLKDAKARRSAADEIDAQFEVQKIRQQLESAVGFSFFFSFDGLGLASRVT